MKLVQSILTKNPCYMGYTMDTFRKAVKAAMGGNPSSGSTGGYTKIMGAAAATAEQMKTYIKSKNPSVAQSVLDMVGAMNNIRNAAEEIVR